MTGIPETIEVVFEYWPVKECWIPMAFITSDLDHYRFYQQQQEEKKDGGVQREVRTFKLVDLQDMKKKSPQR